MKKELLTVVEVPKGVTVAIEGSSLRVKGLKGEVVRVIDPSFSTVLKSEGLVLSASRATKRVKSRLFSFEAHVRNLLRSVQNPSVYKLKVCASHFPMIVAVQKGVFSVKNFVGEKIPRALKIPQNVTVSVEGDHVLVSSPDHELAGQVAGSIERLMVIRDKDRRIFQDGIYIIERLGRSVA